MMKKLFLLLLFFSPILGFSQTWGELLNLAIENAEKGDFDKAIVYMEKAVPLAKKELGKTGDYATVANVLVICYMQVGQYEKAEPLCMEVNDILKQVLGKNHPNYAIGVYRLASIYAYMGEYEKAEPLYLESIAIKKQVLDPDYANSLCGLGGLYMEIGEYEKAEELFVESVDINKRVMGETHPDYAYSLNFLALLYYSMGQYEKAEPLFVKSTDIRKKTLGENHPDYAQSLNNMALLYVYMYKFEKAEPLYLESIAIKKRVLGEGHPDYATGINNLAVLYKITGQYAKAEPLYLESILITKNEVGETHPNYATSINNLAILYVDMGQYEKAEPLFIKSGAIWKQTLGETSPDYANSLFSLGCMYYKMKNYSKAELNYEASKNILLKNIERNFGFLSEAEKEKYVTKGIYQMEVFQSFYYSFSKEKPAIGATAFDIQLATRGMILDAGARLNKNIANSGDTSLISLNENWRRYKTKISQQYSKPVSERNADLKKWEEETNKLEKELIKRSSIFSKVQKSFELKYSDVQLVLKQNEAAIEFISFDYFDGSEFKDSIFYSAVIITKQSPNPVYIPLFEEKQLKGLFQGDSLRTFANLLYTDAQIRTEEHDISYNDSLYQLIWQPIEPYLKNITQVYYAPSGLLHNITFDAILTRDDILLSDKYHLMRSSTTTNILKKDSAGFNPLSISLFGGIQYNVDTITLIKQAKENKVKDDKGFDFSTSRSFQDSTSRGGFGYLAGSKMEVDNIDGIFKKNNISTHIYTGISGTEEAVKNLDARNSPSILHFSTHGFFFPDPTLRKENLKQRSLDNDIAFKYSDNPLFRSGLILAGAEYVWKGNEAIEGVEDGILTAYEVSNLYLPNTKLVVMSACETGLGDIKGSEGVYGLQRAFKMAGVDYIIMTLWQVLDKETSEFMILFYQNLLTKKSIPDAFKMTQDTMKNKYREEPYKWAGFVLVH